MSSRVAQLLTAPNQLTLLRMVFLPLIVLSLVGHNYHWALVLFVMAGLSDTLDGLLARRLHQQTRLGQYLDPVADKLLMSTMFLVLSILHQIPWKFTVVVFSRDISILGAAAVLYATTTLRDFRPSLIGKANTTAEVAAVFFVLLWEVHRVGWVNAARWISLWMTFFLTIISGVHYAFVVGQRLHALSEANRHLPVRKTDV